MEFLKEAAIMHSIDHENIVRLYGVVLSTDSLMLVSELAHLRSLLECLKDSDLRVKFLTVPCCAILRSKSVTEWYIWSQIALSTGKMSDT